MKPPTDRLMPGAVDVGAQPRGVEQRHEAGQRVGERDQQRSFSCFCRTRFSRTSSMSSRPDMRLRPTRARRLRCCAASRSTSDQHEEPDPDQHATEAMKAAAARMRSTVSDNPIASSSRLPRPKYSARGMKCGRRWLHSKRPERLPSAFSPS